MDDQRKLNIAMVCDAVTDCVAGSFISTLRFSELLTEKGHKIIFITGKSPQNPTDGYHKDTIKVYRFPGILLPKSEGQLYISFPPKKRVREIFQDEEIDVVHIIIPTPSAVTSLRAAKSLGIKTVAHSHTQPENLTMHLPGETIQKPLNYIFYKYLSWLYRKADALIYPTEFARRLLHKLEEHKETHVISNGVNTKKFKETETETLFGKFNLPRHTKNVLYVGRLHPEKSVNTLISAIPHIISRAPAAHIIIAGFGHLDTKLEQLVRELGIENHITFLGKVTDEELIMAYSACDIFVLPSFAELEGMAVLEAMACGKPIIIADSKESASTYFVDGNGFLFEPSNHEHLAEQVVALLVDDTLRESMGKASLEQSKLYDIDHSVARLEEIYYALLQK
ncbi:MAG: Glycosyl transferase, group 1 [Parcubacteria group bacterium GW2011_GWA1_47_8]|nr:MAG: Glycosyl transferase, group 1 [Parcubacteria group bacterium GW2011_GWA1_47_8]KKW07883.1 MAG: Glycosyl transferase, group 1 [Parcubacteria group bacterium GW2011_GWA2_49_16]